MKKLSSVILALSLAALSLTGCGSTGTADTTTTCLLYTSPSPRDCS